MHGWVLPLSGKFVEQIDVPTPRKDDPFIESDPKNVVYSFEQAFGVRAEFFGGIPIRG